jgi:lipopolysaccharide heptosyltransferase I
VKILIVKLSSIGDVIHTLPVLSAIHTQIPNAEISWVVEKKSAEILRNNQLLEKIIEIDTKALRQRKTLGKTLPIARRQFSELRASTFDVALDFQGLFKSAAIAKLAKVKKRYGFSKEVLREPASRFLLNETVKIPKKVHIIRKNLLLAEKALNLSPTENNFEFPIFTDESHKLEAEKVFEKTGEKIAILNPAGGWITKLWHAEKFGQLADKLFEQFGITSVVPTIPSEQHLTEKVLSSSKSGKIFAENLSLKGFYELAKRTKVYVGGDTGPTHLAVAANAPIVGIFGPTEWWRNGSPNKDDICVERNDINCRIDCHRRTCGNWICMDISVERVFEAVRLRLEK